MTLKEAKQLVNGKSVKTHSGDIGTIEENFNCKVSGEATNCFMFDLPYPFWNFILEFIRNLWPIWTEFNYHFLSGKIGYISFGMYDCDDVDELWRPSKGWVNTNGTNGVINWEGEFRGNLKSRTVCVYPAFEIEIIVYMGVVNFEGIFTDKRGEPPCFIGNAEHVCLSYNQPPWP
jgi:hypothetical protein